MLVKFAYNEPRFGDIYVDGPEMTEEDILRAIEDTLPEAVDIEILEKVVD